MEITKVSEVESKENPHGVDVRPIYSHENAQVMVLTLKPSESLRRHITPVDVFFYVLEGKGLVEVGEETRAHGMNELVQDTFFLLFLSFLQSNIGNVFLCFQV